MFIFVFFQDGIVSSTKAEMGQLREENQKLKHKLSRVLNDCKSLRMHFSDFFRQEVPKITKSPTHDQEGTDGTECISLTLGTVSSNKPKIDGPKKVNCFSTSKEDDGDNDQELKLGLGCKFNPTPSRVELNDVKKDNMTQTLEPRGHCLKTERSEDNDLLDHIPLKKARVSVKVVCDTQTVIIF